MSGPGACWRREGQLGAMQVSEGGQQAALSSKPERIRVYKGPAFINNSAAERGSSAHTREAVGVHGRRRELRL